MIYENAPEIPRAFSYADASQWMCFRRRPGYFRFDAASKIEGGSSLKGHERDMR